MTLPDPEYLERARERLADWPDSDMRYRGIIPEVLESAAPRFNNREVVPDAAAEAEDRRKGLLPARCCTHTDSHGYSLFCLNGNRAAGGKKIICTRCSHSTWCTLEDAWKYGTERRRA